MSLWSKASSQFGNPTGGLGKFAGFIMAHRKSNIERNNWAVSLLNIMPNDNVLEIGFGPGLSISRMSEKVSAGIVYGIDRSELMFSKAMRRNRTAVKEGRVRLFLSSVSQLPTFDNPLDKVLDVNSFQFWDKKVDYLASLKSRMRKGGTIAIVHQPRKPGATDADVTDAANKFAELVKDAGFKDVRIEKRIMKPVPTICVLGTNK